MVGQYSVSIEEWRKGRMLNICNNLSKGACFDSDKQTLPKESLWASAMAVSNLEPMMLVSGETRDNTLYIVEDVYGAVKAASDPDLATAKRRMSESCIRIVSEAYASETVCHMKWWGDVILLALQSGRIELFRVNRSSGMHLTSTTSFQDEKQETITFPKFQRVDFDDSSLSQKRFISINGNNINFWDMEKPCIIGKERPSELLDLFQSLSCSKHSSCNDIATGTRKGFINIYDKRNLGNKSGMVWSAKHGQQLGVFNVSWSPFVPYWLASAGENGRICIWDVRFCTKPCINIEAHTSSVHSLCWSNSHCEVLTSGGSDASWKLWNSRLLLQLEEFGRRFHDDVNLSIPAQKVYGYDGTIISILPSYQFNDRYYTLTSRGLIGAHSVTRVLLEQMAPHHYDRESNPQFFDIESDIYCRHLKENNSDFLSIMQSKQEIPKLGTLSAIPISRTSSGSSYEDTEHRDEERNSNMLLLTSLYGNQMKISSNSWKFGKEIEVQNIEKTEENTKDAQRDYIEELESFTYGLPPNIFGSIVEKFFNQISNLDNITGMKKSIEKFAAESNVEELLKSQNLILTIMKQQPKSIEIQLLQKIVQAILPQQPVQAIHFGINIAEIVLDQSNGPNQCYIFSELFRLLHLLIYPTIFDVYQPSTYEQSIDYRSIFERKEFGKHLPNAERDNISDQVKEIQTILRDQNKILPMLQLEIEVEHRRAISSNNGARRIVEVVSRQETISVKVLQHYLQALVILHLFDDYVAALCNLWDSYPRLAFVKYIIANFQQAILPQLKQYLNNVIQTVQSFQRKARHVIQSQSTENQDPTLCRKTLLMLIRISHIGNSEVMGENTDELNKLMGNLSQCYIKLLQTIVSNNYDYTDASREAQHTMDYIEQKKYHHPKFMIKEYNLFLEKLKQFLQPTDSKM